MCIALISSDVGTRTWYVPATPLLMVSWKWLSSW
nr:MAG: MC121L-like protein [Molluscum contagiosum virus]